MKQKSNVSFGLKAAYGCGDLGLNLFSMAVGSFITSYYTDSVLMGAAFVGTMMLVAGCFDGVSDIIKELSLTIPIRRSAKPVRGF